MYDYPDHDFGVTRQHGQCRGAGHEYRTRMDARRPRIPRRGDGHIARHADGQDDAFGPRSKMHGLHQSQRLHVHHRVATSHVIHGHIGEDDVAALQRGQDLGLLLYGIGCLAQHFRRPVGGDHGHLAHHVGPVLDRGVQHEMRAVAGATAPGLGRDGGCLAAAAAFTRGHEATRAQTAARDNGRDQPHHNQPAAG